MSVPYNVCLRLGYRGTSYRGVAANPGVVTVAGVLEGALSTILGHEVRLQLAGRTDAGVHARGQVVSFTTDSARFDPERLVGSLNARCGPDIVVEALALVPPTFHARFSARRRTYHYTVNEQRLPDPLRRDLEWHVGEVLDRAAMNQAAAAMVGEHDFTSFCRRPKGQPADEALTREVLSARWEPRGEGRVTFEVAATSFCHQMVRSMVGFCVAVGRGERSSTDVAAVIAARDRGAAAPIAPPEGLVLVAVGYDHEPLWTT